jgi:hypothetical protein
MPTINEQIVSGNDDGHIFTFPSFQTRYYSATSLFASVANSYSHWTIALRFQSLSVPAGATIDSATLTLTKSFVLGTPGIIKIHGNDVDDAPPWATSNLVINIAKTTANTNLDTSSATSANDVTAVVQEIIDRGGWSSGNDIAFGLFPEDAGAGNHGWGAFAYESGSNFPTLDITYTTGGGGGTAASVFYYHLQQQGIA